MEIDHSFINQKKYRYYPVKIYYPVTIPVDIVNKKGKKEELIRIEVPSKVSPFFGRYYYQFLPEDHPERMEREMNILKINQIPKIKESDIEEFFNIFNEEHFITDVHQLNKEYKKYEVIFRCILECVDLTLSNLKLSHLILPGMYTTFNKDTNKMTLPFKQSLEGVQRYAFQMITKRLGDDMDTTMKLGSFNAYHWLTWAVNVIGYPYKFSDYLKYRYWCYTLKDGLRTDDYLMDPFVLDKIRTEYEKRGKIKYFYRLTKREVEYCIEQSILFDFEGNDGCESTYWKNVFPFIYDYLWNTDYPKEEIPDVKDFIQKYEVLDMNIWYANLNNMQLIFKLVEPSWVEKNIYFYFQKKPLQYGHQNIKGQHIGDINFDIEKNIKEIDYYIQTNDRIVYLKFINFMINEIHPYDYGYLPETNPFLHKLNSEQLKNVIVKNDILSYYLIEIFSYFMREFDYMRYKHDNWKCRIESCVLKTYIYILDKYTDDDFFTREIEYVVIPNIGLDRLKTGIFKIHFKDLPMIQKYDIDLSNKKQTLRFLYDYLEYNIRNGKVEAYKLGLDYIYEKREDLYFINE